MLYKNVDVKINFLKLNKKKIFPKVKKEFLKLKEDYRNNRISFLSSFNKNYKFSFSYNKIKSFKKKNNFKIIGIGGSILGSKAIYTFLKHKIKKNFTFIDNLSEKNIFFLNNKRNEKKIFVSKSGNTLETIVNLNLLLSKKKLSKENLFITEKKNNALTEIAKKLKIEIIEHKDYIGGRYSVMSEVGMLPAKLMNLNVNKFKNLNNLIKNKKFISHLISNVSCIYNSILQKKNNSIILNYDYQLNDFCFWYQQLVAESLGKKGRGLMPIISHVPKDNHSLFQLYLDGPKNNFFTIFFSKHLKNFRLQNSLIPSSLKHLKNKSLEKIINAQKLAIENTFIKKKIPFRSFLISEKNEEQLGVLFTFFVLETIILARLMKINPYNQPAVEKVKIETKKFLRLR